MKPQLEHVYIGRAPVTSMGRKFLQESWKMYPHLIVMLPPKLEHKPQVISKKNDKMWEVCKLDKLYQIFL